MNKELLVIRNHKCPGEIKSSRSTNCLSQAGNKIYPKSIQSILILPQKVVLSPRGGTPMGTPPGEGDQ